MSKLDLDQIGAMIQEGGKAICTLELVVYFFTSTQQ
jgi:hypothetical protein